MKKLQIALLALLLVSQSLLADQIQGKIVKISDGDTVVVLSDQNETIKVRLAEIDAPEKNQPWGNNSKQALTSLVATKKVIVLSTGKDRYGRTIGTILIGSQNINKLMVQSGNAWAYTQYVDDKEYFQLQEQAKNNHAGLWSMDNDQTIPPWEWRNKARNK